MHLVSIEPLFESCAVLYKILAYALSSFRMFNNEDVTIGSWMLAMNVNHENTHALCEPDCTDSSIAVWDIPKCSGYYLSEFLLVKLQEFSFAPYGFLYKYILMAP
jgi:hypothetical protein